MRKKLLSGIFFFLLLNLLIKPFWILGIDVGVQNRVGASEYGLYFAIFSFAYMFNILLDLGVTNFNSRNIAQYSQLLQKHLPVILNVKLLLFALFLIVTFVVGAIIGYNSRQFFLLLWISINQFLNSLILYLRSNFSALFLFKTDSLFSIMDKMLMIIFCGIMLWGGFPKSGFTIEHFIYAQTLAYGITAATALAILVHKTGLRRLHWNWPLSVTIIKKSLPFALLALLMSFYSRLDPVMLERILPQGTGATQSGIYAGAFRLLDALVMLVYLVSVPLLPTYAKMIKDGQDVSQITKLVFTLVITVSAAVAITLSFTADDVIQLFYDNNTAEISQVFKVLIFCLIPISSIYVFGTLLTANGNLKTLNIVALASLLTNFVANLILIPLLMSHGSAFAALATQVVSAVAQIVIAIRIFHLHISPKYILQLLGFLAVIICTNLAGLYLGLQWWITIIAVAVISVIMLFALRLANLKSLVAMLLSKEE